MSKRAYRIDQNAVDTACRCGNVSFLHELDGSQPKPKEGLMIGKILEDIPTPEAVESLLNQLRITQAAGRARAERQYKLSYLFGGMDVACRNTEKGTVIVASGPSDEVAEKLAALSDEDFGTVYLERPPSWDTVKQIAVRPGALRSR